MLSVCRLSRSRTGMRKPSGPIGFMCGTEDGMYAAVVTVASYDLCHDPATIVIIFPVTQLHGSDEGGDRLSEHLPRVPVPGQGGPDLVMR